MENLRSQRPTVVTRGSRESLKAICRSLRCSSCHFIVRRQFAAVHLEDDLVYYLAGEQFRQLFGAFFFADGGRHMDAKRGSLTQVMLKRGGFQRIADDHDVIRRAKTTLERSNHPR